MSTVLVIGVGDLGERLAAGLAGHPGVRRLLLAGRSVPKVTKAATTVLSSYDCLVEPVRLDALRVEDVASLLATHRPDLVVQCASRRSPWELFGRDDPAARAVAAAGIALRLPYQLAVPLAVMRAAREAGYSRPIANLSLPDVTGPILAALDLAPTIGLGNASVIQLRARAAWRAIHPDATNAPLIRVIGHHAQVFDVMQADPPADPDHRCRIYLDEQGHRDDGLAYQAPGLAPGPRYNHVTAAAALPVLTALLPDAPPLRWSAPAPDGLPGGYPVRINNQAVALDLPPGVTADEAIAFNQRMSNGDGIHHVDDDGTAYFTPACQEAVADIAADIAEPLPIDQIDTRAARLDDVLRI
ncbi:hypothetical protein K1T35_33130 [Pseudonocardia sp. DSM 110487]|uniref:KR domain-containing protein n=1 Tax=Pseudonocardia sp. DSM 110487 TaxID=2865833 RepID=UPI001C69D6C9|nr:KR domain-containing protein [Pseudonocardia sp. DSM 110487]QYN33331.1 hypothetical protein K1T35_33130 [Pseudonocardia sp. DSM 110487]